MTLLSTMKLIEHNKLWMRQVRELAEWLGYETRNKYEILSDNKAPVGYAAEQQKGIFGFFLRQFLGHWRSFDVQFFSNDRQPWFKAHHPFRWYFTRIEVFDANNKNLGSIERQFSVISKKFTVKDSRGQQLAEVASPLWKPWTFKFTQREKAIAEIQKKWSGLLSEAFTDRDNFLVEFHESKLEEDFRKMILAAAVFIDLMYFEKKE